MASADGGSSHDRLLRFYEGRGYRHRVGAGQRPAVVVIDFSNNFTRGAGGFPGGNFSTELRATARLLEAARSRGRPIYFTTIAYADPSTEPGLWGRKVPWLSSCVAGSHAVEIDADLGRRANERIIVKHFPSAFFGTDLHADLSAHQVDTIVLCGCTASVCVRATAIDAMQHGYRTLLPEGAIGEFDPVLHDVNMRDLDARYADVVSVADAVRYLGGGGLDVQTAPPPCAEAAAGDRK